MKGKKKPKATEPVIAARIQEILQIRLDGAETWDCMSYVAEKQQEDVFPWRMGKRTQPISERQIRRYIQQADAKIVAETMTLDPDAFRRHVAKVKAIHARAVNSGDLSNARGALNDVAELLGFYPPKKIDASVAVSGIEVIGVTNFFRKLDQNPVGSPGPDEPPASGSK